MTPISTDTLRSEITAFTTQRIEAIIARFLPDLRVPPFFCGYRRSGFQEGPSFAYNMAGLHKLGVRKIAGRTVEEAIAGVLRTVDGETTDTFYSYSVSDALLQFGPFDNNPVVALMNDAERDNIRLAVDSTAILDRATNTIPRYARNYWAVLARCEWNRLQLGLITDTTVFDIAMEKVRLYLFENPVGFFDDERFSHGRYDLYSADVWLFSRPLWHLFDQEQLMRNLRAHVRLIEAAAEENGASFAWGRSGGALSICMTMQFAALSLRYGLAADPARAAALVENAFVKLTGWFSDDLINAHRHKNTERYRNIHRLLEMTLTCTRKLISTAAMLPAAPEPFTPPAELFPPHDELIPFDNQNAAVWIFRNEHFSFQFPLVDGSASNYMPAPHSPGILECPIGSQVFCGVPRIAKAGGQESTSIGRPESVEKIPNGLTVTYRDFKHVGGPENLVACKGSRTATWLVKGDTILWDEELTLDEPTEGVSYFLAGGTRRLSVKVTSKNAFHQDTIVTEGMGEMRSPWCELTTLHQIHFEPADSIRFTIGLKLLP